jgi:hypothetical protein
MRAAITGYTPSPLQQDLRRIQKQQ